MQYEFILKHNPENFLVGDIICTNPKSVKNVAVNMKPNEIFIIIAKKQRWSRQVLSIGKTEIQTITSLEKPDGDKWLSDDLLFVMSLGNKIINLKQPYPASAYYFKSLKDSFIINRVNCYIEAIKVFINNKDTSYFKTDIEIFNT